MWVLGSTVCVCVLGGERVLSKQGCQGCCTEVLRLGKLPSHSLLLRGVCWHTRPQLEAYASHPVLTFACHQTV